MDVEAIARIAKLTWEEMIAAAKRQQPCIATTHDRYGTGYEIEGAVAYYVRKVSRRNGADPDEDVVDLVRKYLRHTGNVVVLAEVRPHEFRIFIRSTWNDKTAVVPVGVNNSKRPKDAIDRRAARLSPEEAGETRSPAPVRVMAQPMGEQQVLLLTALATLGGSVTSKSGAATRVLVEKSGLAEKPEDVSSFTNTLKTLEDRGLIERDTKGKRTYRIALTIAGAAAASRAEDNLPAADVVAKYLAQVGAVETSPGNLGNVIGSALNMNAHRVGEALRKLESENKVRRYSRSSGGMPTKVAWIGSQAAASPLAQLAPPLAEPTSQPDSVQKEPVVANSHAVPQKLIEANLGDLLNAAVIIQGRNQEERDALRAQLREAQRAAAKVVEDTDCQTRLGLVKEVVAKIEQGHMTLFDGFQEIRAALA